VTTPTIVRLPIPNAAQLTVKMLQGGQPCAVVLGGRLGPGTAVTAAMGTAWLALFWSRFSPGLSGQVTVQGATIRDTSGPGGISFDVGPPASPGGGAAGTMALAAASYVIQWRTGTGGRSGRGRSYLPGVMPIDVQTDGRTLQPTAVTTWKGRADGYIADLFAASGALTGLDPAVLSFTKGQASEILTSTVPPVLGIQRRRMRA
jgi:hypothetical protein